MYLVKAYLHGERSVENRLFQVLKHIIHVLEKHDYRYAVIGGIANQIWGQARYQHLRQTITV